jgi:hypothetical protein
MTDQTTPLAHVVAQMIRPRPGHRLLFAFDELMAESVIAERCPDPVFITKARLMSRRFIVNSDGLASIVPRRHHVVHGIVWEVHDISLTCLSLQLGVPSIYDRFGAFARDPGGQLIISEFFATRNRKLGSAHPSYLAVIVEAAQKWGFPESYVEELQGWEIDRQAA